MNQIKFFLTCIFLLSCLYCPESYSDDKIEIKIVTEELVPFNYVEDGELRGSATELIKKVLENLPNYSAEFKVLPWARAYNVAIKEDNVLIYSMLRSEEREDQFKWVAKVAELKVGLLRLKSRSDLNIVDLTDLKNHAMAVYVDSAAQHYLEANEISFSNVVANYESTIHLLLSGRVNFVPGGVVPLFAKAKELGVADKFEVVYYFDNLSRGLYAAFSKGTSDEIVRDFKDAFDNLIDPAQ